MVVGGGNVYLEGEEVEQKPDTFAFIHQKTLHLSTAVH